MSHSRRERLAESLRNEIADLVRRELRDPRIGFVTLTAARVSPDLTHARLFVSVLGPEPIQAESVRALNRAAGYLQRAVFKRLRLRKAMSFVFVLDPATRTGDRVEELLTEIRKHEQEEE